MGPGHGAARPRRCQRRGVELAARLKDDAESTQVAFGKLDAALHRDDLQPIGPRPMVGETQRGSSELRPDGTYEQRRPPAGGPEQATHRVLLEHAREIMRAG
jgi:hypothetical protein